MLFSIIWLLVSAYFYGYAMNGRHGVRSLLFGFAPLAIITVFMGTFSIPLHWAIVLGIGAAGAAVRHFSLFGLGGKKEDGEIETLELGKTPDTLGLMAAVFTFALLFYGASQYPYLEDDDPWVHALGVEQVAHTLSAHRPIATSAADFERWYLEPYPPAFDIVLGLARQLNDSTLMTLKFFNALLAGLAVLAFYFWIKDVFPDSKWIPALAALFISAIPGFMSHFIWAQTLAMLLMFVAFMAFARLNKEPSFLLPALVCVAAVLVTQPTVALTFGVISGAFMVLQFAYRNTAFARNLFIVLAGGLLLSSIVFWIPVFLKFGKEQFIYGLGFYSSYFQGGTTDDTSGGIIYSVGDFLFPPVPSKMDQAVGIGLGLILLALAALWKMIGQARAGKSDVVLIFFAVFLLIGFLGVEGNALPLKLFPHRFWVFLAIPVAVLAAYALDALAASGGPRRIVVLALAAFLIFFTSMAPRIDVQTSGWPPGVMWSSSGEISGYSSLLSLPHDTKVFPICAPDAKVIGFDKLSEPWDPEYAQFKKTAFNRSASEVAAFLNPRGYQYVVFDLSCVKLASQEAAQAKLNAYASSASYGLVSQNGEFFLFKAK